MTRLAPVVDLVEFTEARALFLTDLHYPHNDREYIQRALSKRRHLGKRKEKGYYDLIILGGDITEGNTLRAPGATVTGQSEKLALQQFTEDLSLIHPSTRVEMVLGNHDTRSVRETGQDITAIELVAKHHKAGMSENHSIIPLRVGTSMFKLCISHGVGGGSTEASILRFLKNLRDTVDSSCDMYMCGHWHKYVATEEDDRYTIVKGNKLHTQMKPQHFVSCGSPHNYEGSYAEGSTKNKPFKHCSVKGLEIKLTGVPESNHNPALRSINYKIIN